MTRTPYGVGSYETEEFPKSLGPSDILMQEGYIFVYQDVRGKFKSEGEWFHHVPYEPNKGAPGKPLVDESSDTYDTIDWLVKNIPSNGKAGQWGNSYPGWEAAMGMIDAHSALVASDPQASPGDQFRGDNYYHNGAFRAMYAFHWTWSNSQLRPGPTTLPTPPYDYGTPDGYQ